MYKSFSAYVEHREDLQFDESFDNLCAGIAASGVPFEHFWEQVFLPNLLQGKCQNEYQLVEMGLQDLPLVGRFFKPKVNPMAANMGAADANTQAAGEQQAKRQAMLSKYQQQADQTAIPQIKQKFMQAMRLFLKSVGDEAMKTGDKLAYIVAQHFYQHIMKVAQPAIDAYAVKVQAAEKGNPAMADFRKRQQAQMQGQVAKMYEPGGLANNPQVAGQIGKNQFKAVAK